MKSNESLNKRAIVHIITKLELGGAQKVCLALFKESKNENIDTYIITGSKGILIKDIEQYNNKILLDSFEREIKIQWLFKEIQTFIAIVKNLKKLKKKHNNIIVHTHSTKAGLIGRWAAFFAGIKTRIHTIHGYGFHKYQNKLSWIITYLLELKTSFITSHFICVSQADANKGIKLFPNFKNKHSIIRAAIDTQNLDLYKPAAKATLFNQSNFIFGTVSCFKPAKNLLDLLKAFNKVHKQNPNTSLEIIGDGFLRPQIEEFINNNNLHQAIKLWGWQNNIGPIIKNWNAFVLSSLWEGLPCAVVEARNLNIPVISYNTGGINEIIKHNINGLLYNQKDWINLTQGMIQISLDQELYNRFKSFEDNLDEFTYSHMIKQHQKLYQSLQ